MGYYIIQMQIYVMKENIIIINNGYGIFYYLNGEKYEGGCKN